MNTARHRKPGKRGFTLIEMLVVIAIIGGVLALAAPRFLPIILFSTHEGAARHLAHYGRAAIAEAALTGERLYFRADIATGEYWVERISEPLEEKPLHEALAEDDQLPEDDDELTQLAQEELDKRAKNKGTDEGAEVLKEQSTRMAEDSNMRARKALVAQAARVRHDERVLPRSAREELERAEAARAGGEDIGLIEVKTPLLARTRLPEEIAFVWVNVGGVERKEEMITVEIGPAGLDVQAEFALVNQAGRVFVVSWDPVGSGTNIRQEKLQ